MPTSSIITCVLKPISLKSRHPNFNEPDVSGHLDVAQILVLREHSAARRKIIYANLPKGAGMKLCDSSKNIISERNEYKFLHDFAIGV